MSGTNLERENLISRRTWLKILAAGAGTTAGVLVLGCESEEDKRVKALGQRQAEIKATATAQAGNERPAAPSTYTPSEKGFPWLTGGLSAAVGALACIGLPLAVAAGIVAMKERARIQRAIDIIRNNP